jgi:hypothetical protein
MMKKKSKYELQMALAQSCKNIVAYLCGYSNISIVKGRIGLLFAIVLFLA